jgi:hypothetical protein
MEKIEKEERKNKRKSGKEGSSTSKRRWSMKEKDRTEGE